MAYNGINSSSTTMAIDQPNDANWWHEWYTLRWGRYYGTFRQGRYLLPCDDVECDRLDIMHKLFLVTRQYEDPTFGGLYTYRLPDRPRVLDLGCGTGIWAIDTADRHAGRGQIEGWDLNLTQPEAIPPNVSFKRCDFEDPWVGVELNSFDLIHMRMLNGSVENWPRLYGQVFKHLKPGSGYLEQVEIDWRPQCDGDPRPLAESKLEEWSQKVHRGFARAGRKLEMDPNTKRILEDLGFSVEHKTISIALNPWPEPEHRKEMARWFNLSLNQGLEALTFESVIHWLGYPEQEVRELIERVKEDMCRREWRTYCTLHIYVARRPPLPGRRA
ncbi:S-adenosyl-L-methionine-dependent methyltransferase [Nemania abortiva]|nr:S-adenosyl-L-methionine-dependent methyltransferase [Nemania abortiva]